jgi:hypothetical protein
VRRRSRRKSHERAPSSTSISSARRRWPINGAAQKLERDGSEGAAELIEANYIKGLRANVAYTVDYLGETTDKDGNITVQTRVNSQRKGRPFSISIDYVLARSGTGYRMFDMKTDGVGLVENYRTMFNKLIKDKGFAAVIKTMKNKAATINASTTTPPATPATPPSKS